MAALSQAGIDAAATASVATITWKVATCPGCSKEHIYFERADESIGVVGPVAGWRDGYDTVTKETLLASKALVCGCQTVFKVPTGA